MKPLQIAAALAGWLGAAVSVGNAAPTKTPVSVPATRPNIIFVLADDLGYGDLGCYGGSATTPNIDRLASEGIRFTQFYVNSPICSPSRTALTTGQYPARWGITSFIDNRAANERRGMAQWLDLSAPTLARSLQKAGYATGHFGKWHMGGGRDVGEAPLPTQYGFAQSLTQFEGLGDRVLPVMSASEGRPQRKLPLGLASEKLGRGAVQWAPRSKVTAVFVNRALDFIAQADKARQPFYLNLWPDDVHAPYDPPRQSRSGTLYQRVLTGMDAQLGPLFDAIRANARLRSNTLIVFAGDNGPDAGGGNAGPFRGGKGTLYEGGTREAFLVWGPGLIAPAKRGTVNQTAVLSGVDLVPSVLSLAGAGKFASAKSDGFDLSATFRGQKQGGRTAPLFWKRPPDRPGPQNAPLPDLAVREGDWKLLVQEDGTRAQLFDLAKDRGETHNLAASQPQVEAHLKQILLAWNRDLPHPTIALEVAKREADARFVSHFTLKSGDHFDKAQAPDIARREVRVTAKFEGNAPRGVLIAQGGEANGYTLFVDEAGRLVWLIRVKSQITLITSEKIADSAHTALAQVNRNGVLTLALDGNEVARGQAPSGFTITPLGGLDVGSDQGGLVGPYAKENAFSGVLQSVEIDLDANLNTP